MGEKGDWDWRHGPRSLRPARMRLVFRLLSRPSATTTGLCIQVPCVTTYPSRLELALPMPCHIDARDRSLAGLGVRVRGVVLAQKSTIIALRYFPSGKHEKKKTTHATPT